MATFILTLVLERAHAQNFTTVSIFCVCLRVIDLFVDIDWINQELLPPFTEVQHQFWNYCALTHGQKIGRPSAFVCDNVCCYCRCCFC
jgi:hypothetical protein